MKKSTLRRPFAIILSVAVLLGTAGMMVGCAPAATTDPGQEPPAAPPTAPLQPGDDADRAIIPDAPAEVPEGRRLADHIEITMSSGGMPAINPHLPGASGGMAWIVYTMIYDRLIYRVDGGSEFAPMLATSWETEDHVTFIFHLRDDVYFHNGDKFNAAAVVWNIEAAQNAPGTEGHSIWGAVVSAVALDEYTVQIEFPFVDVDLFFELSLPPAGMLSPRAMTENPETGAWVGTGPFMLVDFATMNFAEMVRNDNFWGDLAPTQSVTKRFIPEPTSRLIMQQNGESHFSFGINAEDLVLFLDDEDSQVFPFFTDHIHAVWFNMNHPITGDYYFRMAVAHALDLPEIALAAADIWAEGVHDGSIWGRGTQFRRTDLPNRERNLDLAREYLERSPHNGEEIEITAAIITMIRAAEMVQQQLADIGLSTRINQTDMAGINSMATYENNQIEMAVYLSAARGDAGSQRMFFTSGGHRNGTSFSNPRVNELMELAQQEPDLELRREMYWEVQQIMYDDPPMIPVFWRIQGGVGLRNLGGFYLTADSTHNFRNVFLLLDD